MMTALPSRLPHRSTPRPLLVWLAIPLLLAACGSEVPLAQDGRAQVAVDCGREEGLLQPIFDHFTEETKIAVRVRYGSTPELAAALREGGEESGAQVFLAQDVSTLATLSKTAQTAQTAQTGSDGLLAPLMPSLLDRVAPRFRDPDGHWLGLTGRARVVVYNPERIQASDLPTSLEAMADPHHRGTFGIATTDPCQQAQLAAYRALAGKDALDALLAAISDNTPKIYPGDSALVQGVAAGEVEWGLANHDTVVLYRQQHGDEPLASFLMTEGPAAGFVNLTGLGILRDSPEARRLADYLIGEHAQRAFARQGFEVPLLPSVEPEAGLPRLARSDADAMPEVEFAVVAAQLDETRTALGDHGLLPSPLP